VSLRHPSSSAQLHSRPHARDTHAQAIYRLLALRSGQSTSAPQPWFVGRAYRLCSAGETGQCSSIVLTWLGDLWCTTCGRQGQVGYFPGGGGSLMEWGGFCLVSPRREGLGWACGLWWRRERRGVEGVDVQFCHRASLHLIRPSTHSRTTQNISPTAPACPMNHPTLSLSPLRPRRIRYGDTVPISAPSRSHVHAYLCAPANSRATVRTAAARGMQGASERAGERANGRTSKHEPGQDKTRQSRETAVLCDLRRQTTRLRVVPAMRR
jgi:hypothetical protein